MDEDENGKAERLDVKGKGKEIYNSSGLSAGDSNRPGPPESESGSASILSRLGSSTAHLMGDLTSLPLNQDSMSQISSADKAGSSGAERVAEPFDRGRLAGREAPGPSNTFRTTQRTPLTRGDTDNSKDLEEFFNSAPEPLPAASYDRQTIEDDHASWQSNTRQRPSQRAAHSVDDGMEVVRLLESGYEEEAPGDDEIFMTSEERAGLRRALFQSGASNRIDWEDVLNFFPGYIANGSNGWGFSELSNHMGMSDAEAARSIWVDQWHNVLTSYADEVWGDLCPLVERARGEMQDLAASTASTAEATPSQLQAVRRLQQILAQVRGF
ncbi:hypothetical protein GGR56DRAFT_631292 [Xylariaceae sp. FL0804]|nr:hypothetical protein GGR56DRAFT_631292 [Xylariaceae sp. FL0804]